MPLKQVLGKWSAQAQLVFGALSAGLGGAWMFLQQYPDLVTSWGLDQPGFLKSVIVGILAVNAAMSAITVYLRALPQNGSTE